MQIVFVLLWMTVFQVKSDNADSQFNFCWNFSCWLDFSKRNNITVICYYGVAGNGKGLVDYECMGYKKSFEASHHKR